MLADRNRTMVKLRIALAYLAVIAIGLLLFWGVESHVETPWLRNVLDFLISSVAISAFWMFRAKEQARKMARPSDTESGST